MASAINQSIHPLENKIKNLEIKILEYDTKLSILKKKIETYEDLREKVEAITSYTDKARLSGAIKDIVNIKKQINLTKKSKILSSINQIKQRLVQCENSFMTSDEDDESKKNN